MTIGRDREALGLVTPFALWALGFVLFYAGHGLACGIGERSGQEIGATRWLLAAIFVLVLAAQAWLAWWSWRRLRRAGEAQAFVRLVSVIMAIAAIFATLWIALPIFTLSICR